MTTLEPEALLAQMTLDEKLKQMSGDVPLLTGMFELAFAYNHRSMPSGRNARLDIPALYFTDGPRGVAVGRSTCFPVAMARGATWDVDLEARVGDAIGVEVRSQGANLFGGVCVNLLRHPAWGRAQETYGEDPFHLGEMGAALVRGVQRHALACVKHFAANSIENARFKVDVRIGERALREVYLPHFRRCVDAGAAVVMSAYNQVNGVYCGHNTHLLRDILKGEWGFDGPVVSDYMWGVRDGAAGVAGGLDVELPFTWRFKGLRKLVDAGQISAAQIDEAVLRILRVKLRFAQVGEPERYGPHAIASAAHRALAREAAQKAMVLLKNAPAGPENRPVLPLDAAKIHRLALIGRLATAPNLGDGGSSRVRPPAAVTPLQGLREALGEPVVGFDAGRDLRAAANAACQADVAVVVAGSTLRDEGEYFPVIFAGGDRERLTLSAHDEALIRAVAEANPRTVVVLIGGSAFVTEAWRERVPAILMAWYPGMEGGHALADLLLGRVNPSGKLPCVFPCSEAHLPFFDKNAASIEYGLFHGYRLLERAGHAPAFPFGFGLSYTTFAYRNLTLERSDLAPGDTLRVRVEVANTGAVAGAEVAQLYVGCEGPAVERPLKELKGFVRLELAPGESRTIEFVVPLEQLAYYDETRACWTIEPASYRVYVGASSPPGDLSGASFKIRHDGRG